MERDEIVSAVKAAAALHSTIAAIGDIEEGTSLESIGIGQSQLNDLKKDLHRLLTTAMEQPVAWTKFSSSLKIAQRSTVAEIADMASGLVVRLPNCSTIQPTPDVPTCQIWMTRSYFCRILRAVTQWADAAAIPPDGITPELKLGSLTPNFDAGERLRLLQITNQESVFQPFVVNAGDPGPEAVNADVTVHGYAKVLWDNNPTGCSVIVNFPDEE